MAISVEINELTNNSSKLGVYIEGRPLFWTCHAIILNPSKLPALKQNEEYRFIRETKFLDNVIRRFTDIDLPADDSNKIAYTRAVEKGKEALRKKFSDEDYEKLLELGEWTENISEKMLNKKFTVDGPDALKLD